MIYPIIDRISYKEAGFYAFLTGCLGCYGTLKVTSIDPALGFFAPAATLFLLTVVFKTKDYSKKIFAILAIPFVPTVVGKMIGFSIPVTASLTSAALGFVPLYLLGAYLKKQETLQEV
ncbi:MAG: hypothetical protein LW832_02480 [Parachlamydia sp.]|jgi:hypothetical protein|nr:hypothetical protein [Parachlamydia sp.]